MKRILAAVLLPIVLIGMLSISAFAENPQFDDVPAGAWYADAVRYASEHGLMLGVGNDCFAPETAMTRAMAITMLWRCAGSVRIDERDYFLYYADIGCAKTNDWYFEAVMWGTYHKVVNGYYAVLTISGEPMPTGYSHRFEPNQPITREEFAVMLYRYAQNVDESIVSGGAPLDGFPDAGSVSGYAREAVSWAVKTGCLKGESRDGALLLNPQGEATRAEIAAIMMHYCKEVRAPMPK